jgi:DNA-directed RNA polymerase specialized sigma24 family protein
MLANLDFKILYDTYSERLFGMVIRSLNGDLSASQKVLADIFVRIVEEIKHTEAAQGTLLGWMMMITRQQIRKYEEGQLSVMDWTFEREYRRAAGYSIVLQLATARNLSPEGDYRSVLELVYEKGYNIKQVAEMMNIHHDTVMRLLREGINGIEKRSVEEHDLFI